VHISLPVALCAVCFGLGHLCLYGRVPDMLLISILVSTTVAGLVAGYYREQTGSLLPAIAAHMTFNIVGTLVPLALHAIRT
jgi:membrane protease YdiL (CAAX protease family)